MHNLISYNQLAGEDFDPDNDVISEYYECLIECDESQSICKRICKEVLVQFIKVVNYSKKMLPFSHPP